MTVEPLQPLSIVLISLAAAIGGAINAIAGGGTLVTFPAIVALGIPPLIANATSTVALWPGSVSSMWGYRDELQGARRWIVLFTLPSLAGGGLGAWLLLHTSARQFSDLVPYLVLGATVLFLFQAQLKRRFGLSSPGDQGGEPDNKVSPRLSFLIAQFAVGVYGGYFGAGIGILMLAVLGFMGFTNIHTMNGLKNWGGLCMNAVAAVMFAFSGIVNWPVALAMVVGGLIGGYGGSRMAQRVGQEPVRRAIPVIGLASFIYLVLR